MAKTTRRDLRRAIGNDAVGLVTAQHEGLQQHAVAIEILMTTLFKRSFIGRLKWLLVGK